jgi:hypothetical protein
MKKGILIAVLALFTSVYVFFAQGGQGGQWDPAERAKATIEKLKPELTLTEQQQKDMLPVYTEFYTSMKALRDAGQPTPEARQKLLASRNEKLQKILDAGQMKKLAEYEEKMRQQRKQGGGGGGR